MEFVVEKNRLDLQYKEDTIKKHRVDALLKLMQQHAKQVLDSLDLESRRNEIESLQVKDDNFELFYEGLKSIKMRHRNATAPVPELYTIDQERLEQEVESMFSGDEMMGKYVDLTALHSAYQSIPGTKPLKYIQYLDVFQNLEVPNKGSKQYIGYVNDIKAYLEGYIKRAQPLVNFLSLKQSIVAAFNEQNPDVPKQQKLLKMAEFLVQGYAKHLAVTISDTKDYVVSKQHMTQKERDALIEAPEEEITPPKEEDEDEVDERIYNPLKLPLGWDGKPIPYWLYKLHGLGVEYTCEICGNFSYMGRKAFDKHFQQDTAAKEFKPDFEEYEDANGNVMSRKTYEDLKRQGLI